MSTMRNGFFGLLISLTGCTAYYPQAGGYDYGYGSGYGYATGIPAPVVTGYVGPAVAVGYRRPVYVPVWRGGPERGGHEWRGHERHDGHEGRDGRGQRGRHRG